MMLHKKSIAALLLAAVLPIIVMAVTPMPASSCDHDKAASAQTTASAASASCASKATAATAGSCAMKGTAAASCTDAAAASGCCMSRSATKATVATNRRVQKSKLMKVSPGTPSKKLIQTSITSAPAPQRATPGSAGLKVAIDPQTGQLVRPTPEQMQALGGGSRAAAASSQRAEPEIVYNADGSAMMRLGDSYGSYAKVRKAADGSWVFDCDGNPKASTAAAVAATPAPAPVRHEAAEK